MHEHHPVSREGLRAEARLLRYLLALHERDLQAVRDGTTFIHFVDAHELKSWLRGNRGEHLTGFLLDAERALRGQPSDPDPAKQVMLKAERVQQNLLFESRTPVILLPSHGQEMDEEAAHIALHETRREYRLLDTAREQIDALRARSLPRSMLQQAAQNARGGDERSKRQLVHFLNESAPAVAALLFPSPTSAESRLQALISRSQVIGLFDVDWQAFGLTADQHRELLDHHLNAKEVEAWTRHLSDRRRNSLHANRVDAEALTYLCGLNRLFKRLGVNARALLVTRAVSLLNAVRAPDRPTTLGHTAPDCVRHSRLLVLGPGAGSPAVEAEATTLAGPTLSALGLALQTYDSRLRVSAAARTDDAGEALQQDAASLVAAWQDFEGARFTMDLAHTEDPEGHPGLPADDDLQGLLDWLRSDADIAGIVQDRLKRRVAKFNASVFARDAVDVEHAAVRTAESRRHHFRRAQSIAANGLGPIDLPQCFFDADGAFRIPDESVGADAADDYLAWAFVQGCRGAWALAVTYAEQAELSACLFGRAEAAHESRLLRAQLYRMGGSAPWPAAAADEREEWSQRSTRARQLLEQCRDTRPDARVEAEIAAQMLEGLLRRGSREAKDFIAGLEVAEAALNAQRGPPEERIRLLEVLLCYVLATQSQLSADPLDPATLGPAVATWHRDLVAAMDGLRRAQGVDALPRCTRAVEILGYELTRRLGSEADGRSPPQIPAALLFDVVTLQSQVSRCNDSTSRLLAVQLSRLIDHTRGRRQFELVYAPTRERADIDREFSEIANGSARAAALEATAILHDVGSSQQFLVGDRTERERLATARALLQQAIADPDLTARCCFSLEVEHGYVQLLGALAQEGARRSAALEDVARYYRDMAARYPASSIVRYRLSIVLSDLEQHEASFDEIRAAVALIGRDEHIRSNHWLHSIVRRRLALRYAAEAQDMLQQLRSAGDQAGLRTSCLQNLKQAFDVVNEDFDPVAAGHAYLERLECRRRLNNLVYYAALYRSAGGDLEDLGGLTRRRLAELTAQLHADGGIADVAEWGIAHTIGIAYSTLGDRAQCALAGERILHLISRSGENADSAAIRHVVNDALSWKGHADTVPAAFA